MGDLPKGAFDLTVARTYPQGWPIMRVNPPYMDNFDEFEVGQFVAWCLTNSDAIEELRAGGLAAELARLRDWKAQAAASLAEWHDLEHLIPTEFSAARLGAKWPAVVADFIRSLQGGGE